MLNKITGCESRTVPPLYVLPVLILAKAGHWRILWEGRSELRSLSPQGTSQKTYEVDSPIICVYTDGVLVAEKRLRCYSSGTAAYLHLGGM